nr:hypothetical protein [Tanacetum cinerariifolium]
MAVVAKSIARDNERRRDQANKQIEKFYKIFKDMSFEISFTDALILMPKFASTLKALIGNKEKLSKMARTPINEHCSAVILNKLPRKLRDPDFEPDPRVPLILRRCFLKTGQALIDGDILLLEAILNSGPLPPLPNHEQYMPSFKKELKVCEAKTVKYSVDEPPEDSLNSAAGGNFLDKMPRECLKIIESKSKVRQSRAMAVVAKVSTSSSTPAISSKVSELKDMVRALLLDKKNQSSSLAQSPTTALVKAVEPNCVTCDGAQSYQNFPATSGNVYRDNIQDVSMPNLKPSIPYLLRRDNERRRDQANKQIEKFYKIFKDMSFEISFTDALILMPKFASTLKALIGNKEKLTDLGASINLMPLFVWDGLSFSKLNPTCMTLELADRLVSKPIGIAKDVSVKVGVFHFPTNFVVVDFEPDPRVPLILRRCFLKTGQALID